ncbi:MAG: porin, partial [Betaproteobacteria bacterium]|nr:porin [Betaproteobacteria bacterium]
MKQKLLAVAVSGALAALAAPASFAQSTATISGSINVGIMATGAEGASGDANVASQGGGANAININTTEDLGGGMKGGFQSQMRFNAATGDRNSAGTGYALLHVANAYLQGGFGTVRLGKIGEMHNCGFDPWGCTGGAGMVAGHSGSVSALIAGGTTANAVHYTTPNFNGVSLSLQTSRSTRTNERRLVSIDYARGPITAQWLQLNNTANTWGDSGSNPGDAKAKGTSLGASYDLKFAKLNVINAVTKNADGQKTVGVSSLSGSVPMGAYTWLAGYNKSRTGGNYTATSANDTKFAVGVNYALSKRTTLGADVFNSEVANGS